MIWGPKKIKELESENEELKALLDGFSAKEERLKRFEELIKKARIEFAGITKRKDQTAQTLEKLESERTKLNKEIQKLSYEIKQLQEMKVAEDNQLLTLNNVLHKAGKLSNDDLMDQFSERKNILEKEIDAYEKRRDDIKIKTLNLEKRYEEINQKAKEATEIEGSLRIEIERRKEEVKDLIEKQKFISNRQQENIYPDSSELQYEKEKISEAIREENRLKESIELLSSQEALKKEQITDLDKKICDRKSQLDSLILDYKAGVELLNAVSNKENKLDDDLKSKRESLGQLNESIEIATSRLTDLNSSLEILDEEFATLSKEIDSKKSLKIKTENELNEKTIKIKELEEYLKELKETTGILARLKNDIEDGSGLSAKRFTGILKYYSTYISEMYKQKLHLEKILDKKEKDVEEKDKLLEEKQSALYELDRTLFIDQDTAQFFSATVDKIRNQWEQIKIIVSSPTGSSFDKILKNNDKLDVNKIFREKLLVFENTMKEMTQSSGRFFNRINNKKTFLESEREEYDNRLKDLNNRIEKAVNELSNLHDSIHKIKEEHEEHRQDINKLASIKDKLQKEIKGYEATIDKYNDIMDKIKFEQKQIKEKRLSREQNVNLTEKEFESKRQERN